MAASTTPHPGKVRVWDPWIRISHWLLAGAFFVAYFVVEEPMAVHVWAGYLIGALIAIRIVWGVIGPRHARFADFVPSPGRLRRYVADLFRSREPRHLGHNPAGGVMVVALLLSLAATVGTGLMVYGAEEKAGPLGDWYAVGGTALHVVATARADEAGGHEESGEDHEEAETLEELHEFFANVTLFLVGLHIAGVVLTSLREGQNLPRAMITGRKHALDPGKWP
ncbi:cytochrome b/b6 domain-containing protein [Thiohalorhabdus sp.]|uniref:cytochrome b/b6 domain-containing protein n=1 Tax=Thiohalorhabdus sp. TaxID=3094134 RepID=UPI002FC39C7D